MLSTIKNINYAARCSKLPTQLCHLQMAQQAWFSTHAIQFLTALQGILGLRRRILCVLQFKDETNSDTYIFWMLFIMKNLFAFAENQMFLFWTFSPEVNFHTPPRRLCSLQSWQPCSDATRVADLKIFGVNLTFFRLCSFYCLFVDAKTFTNHVGLHLWWFWSFLGVVSFANGDELEQLPTACWAQLNPSPPLSSAVRTHQGWWSFLKSVHFGSWRVAGSGGRHPRMFTDERCLDGQACPLHGPSSDGHPWNFVNCDLIDWWSRSRPSRWCCWLENP